VPPARLPLSPPLLALLLALASCSRGIQGAVTYSYRGGERQEGRIQYGQTPPAGGADSPLWQNCGVYTAPLYDEYAVHSLERGAVWVTYRPDLPAAGVAELRRLVAGQPLTLLSPYPGLPSRVVITAWNVQLAVDDPADPRLAAFVKRYAGAESAPERVAPCTGGVSETRVN